MYNVYQAYELCVVFELRLLCQVWLIPEIFFGPVGGKLQIDDMKAKQK